MHILVDGNISVQEGHDISEEVKLNLMRSNEDILDVLVTGFKDYDLIGEIAE